MTALDAGSDASDPLLESIKMTQSTQGTRIAAQYPKLYATLCSTWYAGRDWTATREGKYNDAGYWLWVMSEMQRKADSLHGHKGYTPHELDRAASREILYHFHRGAEFRDPTKALARCILNMVSERPEHLEAARKCGGKEQAATPKSPPQIKTPAARSGMTTLGALLK